MSEQLGDDLRRVVGVASILVVLEGTLCPRTALEHALPSWYVLQSLLSWNGRYVRLYASKAVILYARLQSLLSWNGRYVMRRWNWTSVHEFIASNLVVLERTLCPARQDTVRLGGARQGLQTLLSWNGRYVWRICDEAIAAAVGLQTLLSWNGRYVRDPMATQEEKLKLLQTLLSWNGRYVHDAEVGDVWIVHELQTLLSWNGRYVSRASGAGSSPPPTCFKPCCPGTDVMSSTVLR